MIITGDFSLNFEDGLSCKNTILAFRLADWQVNLLCETIKRLTDRKINIFVADDFTDVYAIPHFIAFLNFAQVPEDVKEGYLEFLQECLIPFEFDEEIMEPGVSLTYLFAPNLANVKIPNVIVNSDIFIAADKLRLTLLQEIKKIEGRGQACENSIRLRRVLYIYRNLLNQGWISGINSVSKTMFRRDVFSIQAIDSRVQYDKKAQRYIFEKQHKSVEEDKETVYKNVSRLSRLLLIYRRLLQTGWITKDIVDTMFKPVISLRTFLRDIYVLRDSGCDIIYDKVNKRYQLAEVWQSAERTMQ